MTNPNGTIEAAFKDMMQQTVTLYAQDTVDAYGRQSFSSHPVHVRCHIVADDRFVRRDDGVEVRQAGRAYCFGTPEVTFAHRLVLPDGTDAIVTEITVKYDDHAGTPGGHHTVIGFGRNR